MTNGWTKWCNEVNRTVSYWNAVMPVGPRVRKFSGWERNKESNKTLTIQQKTTIRKRGFRNWKVAALNREGWRKLLNEA